MGKLKHSVLILGEGPTEFYYFNSLRDVVKGLTIKPDYPKHSSMKELEEKIEDGIKDGHDRIFCVVDMDTKDEEPESTQYARLKRNTPNLSANPRKAFIVRCISLRRTAAQNCSFYTIIAIQHVRIMINKSCCLL